MSNSFMTTDEEEDQEVDLIDADSADLSSSSMAVPPPLATSVSLSCKQFGLFFPGGPVSTAFVPADATGGKFAMTFNGLTAGEVMAISDVVFFLLPDASPPLPENHGALLYWQASFPNVSATTTAAAVTTGFELLGGVAASRPSGVFRTGWANAIAAEYALLSSNDNNHVVVPPNTPVVLTMGVSVEPIENMDNLRIASKGVEDRMHVASKIARDLSTFLQSFTNGPITPTHLDRWMERFERKSKHDPNFFLKSSPDA